MKLTKSFFNDVRDLIVSARAAVAHGIDLVQVHTNFEIGRRIVEQEQKGKDREAYGKEVIKVLADRLTSEFGEGFSKRNLELMRRFYSVYATRVLEIVQSATAQSPAFPIAQSATAQLPALPIAQTLSAQLPTPTKARNRTAKSSVDEKTQALADPFPTRQPHPFTLSWTHYVFLLGIKNPDERSFYEIEATSQNWTVRELKRQFDSSLYERLALSHDKDGIRKLAQQGQVVADMHDLLKEPLVLEFLGLKEQTRFSESDLEIAIINQIERFLLELGKGFLFEARQHRFTFDGEHYFVDLVFYNRLLRCYVLIDLKLGKLTHQDLGQMQMYVNTFDRDLKTPEENPTIGIILCKKKNSALVRITLPKDSNIHAREYRLYLPSKEELQRKLVEWTADREVVDE